jgi:hypothetical protein
MPSFLKLALHSICPSCLKNRSLVYASLFLSASTLFAFPQKEEVAAGQADFQTLDDTSLQITASDKAIINYHSFNIGEGEYVRKDLSFTRTADAAAVNVFPSRR